MRSNTVSVNEYDDSVCGFDASTCSSKCFYDIFENEDKFITEDSFFWVNSNKKIGKEGSLNSLQ